MEQLDKSIVCHIFLVAVETVSLLPDVVSCVLMVLLVERFLYYWWSLSVRIQILHVWKAHIASHLWTVIVLVEEALVHIVLGEEDAAIFILCNLSIFLVIGMHIDAHFIKELSLLNVVEVVQIVSIRARLINCLKLAPFGWHLDKDLCIFVFSRTTLLGLGHIILKVLRRWGMTCIDGDLFDLDVL